MLANVLDVITRELFLDPTISVQKCDVSEESDFNQRRLVLYCERNDHKFVKKFKICTEYRGTLTAMLSMVKKEDRCPENAAEMATFLCIAKKLSVISSEAFFRPHRFFFALSDGSLTLEEDISAEKFKNSLEADVNGYAADEIVRSLAAFHAASASLLKDRDEWQSAEMGSSISLPAVLSVGNFQPENIFLRYRGCGSSDVRFDLMSLQPGSPLEDFRLFFRQYVESRNKSKEETGQILRDLAYSYYKRFYEVCDYLNLRMLWVQDQFLCEAEKGLGYLDSVK